VHYLVATKNWADSLPGYWVGHEASQFRQEAPFEGRSNAAPCKNKRHGEEHLRRARPLPTIFHRIPHTLVSEWDSSIPCSSLRYGARPPCHDLADRIIRMSAFEYSRLKAPPLLASGDDARGPNNRGNSCSRYALRMNSYANPSRRLCELFFNVATAGSIRLSCCPDSRNSRHNIGE
jgi:hypothetical protein